MAFNPTFSADRSMNEINTTPLIDVLLVLLIIFIITIPASTHTTEFDLPSEPAQVVVNPVVNKVVVSNNSAILWNGNPITQPQLASLLNDTRQLAVEPELQFEPQADASYELAASVMTVVKQSGVTKFGFVGNERFSQFDKAADDQR